MKSIGQVLASLLLLVLGAPLRAEPPRVVSASPDNGQTDVDPTTKQIKIVFDQPMDHGGMSIVGGGPNFPKIVGKPRWIDDRTIVVNVQLRADHDYWLSVNGDRFTNFRSAAGEPAVPYPIAFSTAAGKQAATLPADLNRESIQQLREAIDQEYSYRDLRNVDWNKLFAEYSPKLEKSATARDFAKQTASLLANAKDMHILVKVGDSVFPTHRPGAGTNFNIQTLSRIVPKWSEHGAVVTGRFDDKIVYILIGSWDRSASETLERAYAAIPDAKGLIIDVRPNSGGDEMLARAFAGCFIDRPHVYSKNTTRQQGAWLGPYERVVEPNPARPRYSGPIVVLMGPQNMSSCESFLLMMRQVPRCKLIGQRSYGSSGNPKPVELANGVTVLLPSWKDMLPDGSVLEGVGVKPDIEVKTDSAQLRSNDPILETALKLLRSER
jgi:hypothetical protein